MVGSRCNSRKVLGLVALIVVALAFGGCDWTMFGYDAGHTGSSADTAINRANAATLKPLFSVPAQIDPNGISSNQFGPPVESNGMIYVGSGNAQGTGGSLEAFDGTATIYGWTSTWNTTTVPNGTYILQSVASYGGEVTGASAGITVTVSN